MRVRSRRRFRVGPLFRVGLGALLCTTAPLSAAWLTVTTNADNAASPIPGSLRQAILDSNASVGVHDTIVFDIAGGVPQVIVVDGVLPPISDPVTIDGYTQPGAQENTDSVLSNAVVGIEIKGSDGRGVGIDVQDGYSVLRGLQVSGFSRGIYYRGLLGVIEGCFLKLNNVGAWIDGSFGYFGGSRPAARNVVTENTHSGVVLGGSFFHVAGNLIGVDGSGNAAGNSFGMRLYGDSHLVGRSGVLGSPNVVSANFRDGIYVGDGSTEINIYNNLIGVDPTGEEARPNGGDGIHVAGTSSLGVHDIVVGKLSTDTGNRIAFNRGAGVRVDNFAWGVLIRHNEIYRNHGLGIDLVGVDGVDDNDAPPDADAGGNNLQNFPRLLLADIGTGNVLGELDSSPDDDFAIDLYGNEEPDASGHGEGQEHLGSVQVKTDGAGHAAFQITPSANAYTFLSATATRLNSSDTSEFSDRLIRIVGTSTVTNTNDSAAGSLRQGMSDAESGWVGPGVWRIVFDISGPAPHIISPLTPLPQVSADLWIDGTTEPNFIPNSAPPGSPRNGTTAVELRGGPFDPAFLFDNKNLILSGLAFGGWANGAVGWTQTAVIEGNQFGTSGGGSVDIGVELLASSPSSGVIGGTQPSQRNDFLGSNLLGALVETPGIDVRGNHFENNAIGVGFPDPSSDGNQVSDNYFTNSTYDAVSVIPTGGDPPTGNRIWRNSMNGSGRLGIDLGADGVTANDAGDVDNGPNTLINTPISLEAYAASANGPLTYIFGDYESAADSDYFVDLYAGSSCNTSGHGEGEVFLGEHALHTDAGGLGSFAVGLPVELTVGDIVTATATDVDGNTSEFSACATVATAPPFPNIDVAPARLNFGPVAVGDTNTLTFSVSNAGDATLSITDVAPLTSGFFSISSDGCTGANLAPAAFCEIDIDFTPTGNPVSSDWLTISSNDPVEPKADRLVLGTTPTSCPAPEDLVVSNVTLTTTVTVVGCNTITAGPNAHVETPGDVTLRAGTEVALEDDFSVGSDATLTIEIDSSLGPP